MANIGDSVGQGGVLAFNDPNAMTLWSCTVANNCGFIPQVKVNPQDPYASFNNAAAPRMAAVVPPQPAPQPAPAPAFVNKLGLG